MKKQVLFIQGGGERGFEVDAKLVASLKKELGAACQMHYPGMLSAEALPDFDWQQQISNTALCTLVPITDYRLL